MDYSSLTLNFQIIIVQTDYDHNIDFTKEY